MMPLPKISIVIVVYNAVATIEYAIKSVLEQTYPNVELIIVDGGSTDGTVEVVERYKENIYYYHSQKDKGIFDAMNQGQEIATGDFLLFLGSDDLLYNKEVIANFVAQIKDFDTVHYGDVYLSNEKRLYDGHFTTIRLALQCPSHQALFYSKKVFKSFKYNIKYKYAADYDLNMQVWGKHKPFQRIDLTTALFNQNGEGSANEDTAFLKDKLSITYKTLGFIPAAVVFTQRLKLKILGKNVVFNFYR